MDKKLRKYNIAFYSVVTAGFVFIFFTNPFLIKEYDPWRAHLTYIKDFLNQKEIIFVERYYWHIMLANVFKFFGISNIFTWAKIIHVFQFLLAAVIMFYFSKTALNILIKSPLSPLLQSGGSKRFPASGNDENDKNALLKTIQIKFLSLFAVFLWFIGNGTFSVAYQQAWIMWYSVTYQGLTIPLFWYATALTLKLFYDDLPFKKILFYIAQIILLSLIIIKVHAPEFLYYLITLSVVLLINSKRIFGTKNKKILFISIPILFLTMFIIIRYFLPTQVPLFKLISSNESIGQIVQKINSSGHLIVSNLNRFPNSFPEIALISLIGMVIFRIKPLFIKNKDISSNINLFDTLLISSFLFFLIPMVPFLAGLASYLTYPEIVYRFFFASAWFIFLPFFIYVIMNSNSKSKILNAISNNTFYRVIKDKEIVIPGRKVITDILAAGLVLFVLFAVLHAGAVAKRNSILRLVMFETTTMNIKSIINSLDKNKVGM